MNDTDTDTNYEIVTTDAGTFRIGVRDDPEREDRDSPREDGQHQVGVMVLRHRRHSLPFEGDLKRKIDGELTCSRFPVVARWLRVFHGATTVLPVWGSDHPELRLTAGTRPIADRWDSGLAGIIYDTPGTRQATGVPLDKIEEALRAEVADYDAWSHNEVYSYALDKLDGQGAWHLLDSAGGYYSPESAREAAREALVAASSPGQ